MKPTQNNMIELERMIDEAARTVYIFDDTVIFPADEAQTRYCVNLKNSSVVVEYLRLDYYGDNDEPTEEDDPADYEITWHRCHKQPTQKEQAKIIKLAEALKKEAQGSAT